MKDNVIRAFSFDLIGFTKKTKKQKQKQKKEKQKRKTKKERKTKKMKVNIELEIYQATATITALETRESNLEMLIKCNEKTKTTAKEELIKCVNKINNESIGIEEHYLIITKIETYKKDYKEAIKRIKKYRTQIREINETIDEIEEKIIDYIPF